MQIRNAGRTRGRILAAATRLFAKSGFDGTSVDDIVRATRCNKRMLYHYFGDKRGLYRAVFLAQWTSLQAALGALPTDDLAEAIRALVGGLSDYFSSHQRFVRLLLWEGLEGGGISRSLWKDVRGPLFEQSAGLVRRAQKAGLVDGTLDPAHLVVTFLGAIMYYYAYAPSIEDMIGKPALRPSTLEERRREMVRLVEALFVRTGPKGR